MLDALMNHRNFLADTISWKKNLIRDITSIVADRKNPVELAQINRLAAASKSGNAGHYLMLLRQSLSSKPDPAEKK
jgi:hypothetical protein